MLLKFRKDSNSNTTIAKLDGINVLWNNGKEGEHDVMFIGHGRNIHPATGLPTTLFVAEVKDSFMKAPSNSELFKFSNNPSNIETDKVNGLEFDVYLTTIHGTNPNPQIDNDYPVLVGLDNYHNFKIISKVVGE